MSPPAPNRKQKNRHSKFPCLVIFKRTDAGIILLDRKDVIYSSFHHHHIFKCCAAQSTHLNRAGI